MAILEIIKVPDKRLRMPAKEVKNFNSQLEKLVQDMAETMYSAPGIGLAGNQVGALERVCVIDVSHLKGERNLLVLVNPVLLSLEGEEEIEEGCLSIPDFRQEVKRATKVRVLAKDINGKEIELFAEGLLARAIQHEVDHLKGRLILDYASGFKRELYIKRLKRGFEGKGR